MTTNSIPAASVTLALLLGFVCSASAEQESATWRGQSVTEFSAEENDALQWQVVDDGVMGGLSEGKVEFSDAGTMKFSGDLSLENNGGFSTVRSAEVDLNLSDDLGLLMLVKGDGRTYEARLDSDARFRGNPVSFSGEFSTKKGEWIQVQIPFSEFKGSFRGTDLPDMRLNPSMIERLWVLLADKQNGAFDLEIDWIRTYGKGQGDFTERNAKPVSSEGVPATKQGRRQLIATAVADGRFTTLKTALDAAGLTPFFQWDNPLTVFAPTDEAFAKLPKEVLSDLLKPENKEKLIAILSYHVSAGSSDLAGALQAKQLETVAGPPLEVSFSKGRVRVNEALLVDSDIQCSDGIIHVVDAVLLPPQTKEPNTVLSVAKQAGSFSTLLAAVDAAKLSDLLKGDGPFTVLAPTDEAFAALPQGAVSTLLKEENRDDLVALLKYHVVAGRVSAGDALNAGKAKTVQGDTVKFSIENGTFKANESTIQSTGIEGGNGLIHVIDAVLMLPHLTKKFSVLPGKACCLSPNLEITASETKGSTTLKK